MKDEEVELTHFALSSLLHCCLRTEGADNVALYDSIWSEFVCDHSVRPDVGCYGLAIKAASRCLHSERVRVFAQEMKVQFGGELDVRKWNGLFAAFGRLGDVDAMLTEYEAMKQCGVEPDCYTASILVNGAVNRGAASRGLAVNVDVDRFETLLSDILERHLVDDWVFGGILDGLVRSGRAERVEAVWQRVVEGMGIRPNVLCYALRIMAAAQCRDALTVDAVVAELRALEMKVDRFCFHQILTAYGRLGALDRMWTEFENESSSDLDIGALSILSALEERPEHRRRALDEAMRRIPDWSALSRHRQKHFYRMSCIAEHVELQSMLWPLIESAGEAVQVEAHFVAEGERRVLDNSYRRGEGEQVYNELTDELIERVGHCIDTAKHPEVRTLDPEHQLSDEHALKMLKYHAEKRALALMLRTEPKEEDVVMTVTMRMCADCHRFFCSVSRAEPQRRIICVDPTKRHVFHKGTCSCGKD